MYAGKCHGGPYDGQFWAQPSQDFPVTILLPGSDSKGIVRTMDVHYQWRHNAWYWQGGRGPLDDKKEVN